MKEMKEKKSKTVEKRQKDQFSMTLVAMLLYSAVLITIVAGTYLGARAILKDKVSDKQLALKEFSLDDEDESEAAEGEITATTEEVENEEKTVSNPATEKVLDVSKAVKKSYIDYDTTVIEPKKRNSKLTWSDTTFSKLENVKNPAKALVNSYDFTRKRATCYDDKNLVLEIYSNPSTHLAEKISAIEYCGDVIETIDYYYNNGRVNYIAQYQDVINTPIDISSSKVQSRFYFGDDMLLRYVYCEGNKATEYNVSNLKNCSMGTVEQYDYLEKEMLNKAYITYNAAKLLPETVVVEGYVFDEFNTGLSNVKVSLIADSKKKVKADTKTNGDGFFSMEIEPDSAETFTLSAEQNTLKFCSVYGISLPKGSLVYDVEPIYLGYKENEAEYNETVLIKDAKNPDNSLEGATVSIRDGINTRKGSTVATGELDSKGMISLPLTAGCYTAEVKCDGYITGYYPLVVKQDRVAEVGYTVPELEDEEYVSVLAWDQNAVLDATGEQTDLDLRSFSSCAGFVVKSETTSDGSIPREIIDIKNTGNDTFSYYVSDYKSCVNADTMTYTMSLSNARVYVFEGNEMKALYHVPMGHAGVVWKPFELRNRKLIPINDYHYVVDSASRFTSK